MNEINKFIDTISLFAGDDIYKCPKCGAGMFVWDGDDCPWQYNNETKMWEHACLNEQGT